MHAACCWRVILRVCASAVTVLGCTAFVSSATSGRAVQHFADPAPRQAYDGGESTPMHAQAVGARGAGKILDASGLEVRMFALFDRGLGLSLAGPSQTDV